MSNSLAQYNANLNVDANANLNNLIGSHSAEWDYWYGYRPYPWWPTPAYPLTFNTFTIATTTKQHRVCTCPNCDGACCDCADCEVKRLKARVAELEKGQK